MSAEPMRMFDDSARELMIEGGADPDRHPDRVAEISAILSQAMAVGSALHGLSTRRVTNYQAQKASLIQDIRAGVRDGWLEPVAAVDIPSTPA